MNNKNIKGIKMTTEKLISAINNYGNARRTLIGEAENLLFNLDKLDIEELFKLGDYILYLHKEYGLKFFLGNLSIALEKRLSEIEEKLENDYFENLMFPLYKNTADRIKSLYNQSLSKEILANDKNEKKN